MHKYKLLGRKGEGTFSEVLKAQSIKSGKFMAIKCMKHVFESIDQVNNLREIQALRRLSPHPNIVKLYEVLYDQPTGRLALVFELMDCNIYELIKGRNHYLPEETVKGYMYQLMKAVDHMHRHGIFHRDIKPENLLIADNVLKLADFGSCRGIYSKQPYTEYISTRWYRAPECLLTDGYYGYKMDLWGVGCVLFETLALYPLFPGTNEADQIERIHKILGTPPAEILDKFKKFGSSHVDFNFAQHKRHTIGLAKLLPHVSQDAIDLLHRLLIYDPDERITARDALRHPWFSELRAADRRAREEAKARRAAEEAANGTTGASGNGEGHDGAPSPSSHGSPAHGGPEDPAGRSGHDLGSSGHEKTGGHDKGIDGTKGGQGLVVKPAGKPKGDGAAGSGQHKPVADSIAASGAGAGAGLAGHGDGKTKSTAASGGAASGNGAKEKPGSDGKGGSSSKTGHIHTGMPGIGPDGLRKVGGDLGAYQLHGTRIAPGKDGHVPGASTGTSGSGKAGDGKQSGKSSNAPSASATADAGGTHAGAAHAHAQGHKAGGANAYNQAAALAAAGAAAGALSPYGGPGTLAGGNVMGAAAAAQQQQQQGRNKYGAGASSVVAAAKNELAGMYNFNGGMGMAGMPGLPAGLSPALYGKPGMGPGAGMAGVGTLSPGMGQAGQTALPGVPGLGGKNGGAGPARRLDPLLGSPAGGASGVASPPSLVAAYSTLAGGQGQMAGGGIYSVPGARAPQLQQLGPGGASSLSPAPAGNRQAGPNARQGGMPQALSPLQAMPGHGGAAAGPNGVSASTAAAYGAAQTYAAVSGPGGGQGKKGQGGSGAQGGAGKYAAGQGAPMGSSSLYGGPSLSSLSDPTIVPGMAAASMGGYGQPSGAAGSGKNAAGAAAQAPGGRLGAAIAKQQAGGAVGPGGRPTEAPAGARGGNSGLLNGVGPGQANPGKHKGKGDGHGEGHGHHSHSQGPSQDMYVSGSSGQMPGNGKGKGGGMPVGMGPGQGPAGSPQAMSGMWNPQAAGMGGAARGTNLATGLGAMGAGGFHSLAGSPPSMPMGSALSPPGRNAMPVGQASPGQGNVLSGAAAAALMNGASPSFLEQLRSGVLPPQMARAGQVHLSPLQQVARQQQGAGPAQAGMYGMSSGGMPAGNLSGAAAAAMYHAGGPGRAGGAVQVPGGAGAGAGPANFSSPNNNNVRWGNRDRARRGAGGQGGYREAGSMPPGLQQGSVSKLGPVAGVTAAGAGPGAVNPAAMAAFAQAGMPKDYHSPYSQKVAAMQGYHA